jgi:hypothetical protein
MFLHVVLKAGVKTIVKRLITVESRERCDSQCVEGYNN